MNLLATFLHSPRPVRVGAACGGLLVSPVALYTGIVFGTLGGGFAEHFLGGPAIPFGILLAVVGVGGAILAGGALVGASLAFFGLTLWRRAHHITA